MPQSGIITISLSAKKGNFFVSSSFLLLFYPECEIYHFMPERVAASANIKDEEDDGREKEEDS
jgi:hypothetical protein